MKLSTKVVLFVSYLTILVACSDVYRNPADDPTNQPTTTCPAP